MPVNKRRAVVKAILLAPVAPIEAWAMQQLITGNTVAGSVALVLGALMVALYVAIQEYDIPYEDEIIGIVASNVSEDTADDVVDAVKGVSNKAQETVDEQQSSGSTDEVSEQPK